MKARECQLTGLEKIKPKPTTREISAAQILADYYKTSIEFIPRSNRKTPDFSFGGRIWELKTPIGTGKYNIQHALRSAMTQSKNIIVDARFSKQHIVKIKNELSFQFNKSRSIKKLIMIDKCKNVVEFSRKKM